MSFRMGFYDNSVKERKREANMWAATWGKEKMKLKDWGMGEKTNYPDKIGMHATPPPPPPKMNEHQEALHLALCKMWTCQRQKLIFFNTSNFVFSAGGGGGTGHGLHRLPQWSHKQWQERMLRVRSTQWFCLLVYPQI